jgi:phage terminase small subunit
MSQREAYIQAGYSTNQSLESIDILACKLAKNTKVQLRIAQLIADMDNSRIMSVTERLERLSEIARAKLTDFMDENGNVNLSAPNNAAISEYTVRDWEKVNSDGSGITISHSKKVKLQSAIQAMDIINKMERIYGDGIHIDNRKVEINGLTDDQLERIIASRDRALASG